MTDTQLLEKEIKKFKNSPKRMAMITGEKYYLGEHDIYNGKELLLVKMVNFRKLIIFPIIKSLIISMQN